MARTKDLTVEVDEDLIRRLKVYCAITGQTIKSVVGRWIGEKLPPLPREIEATS